MQADALEVLPLPEVVEWFDCSVEQLITDLERRALLPYGSGRCSSAAKELRLRRCAAQVSARAVVRAASGGDAARLEAAVIDADLDDAALRAYVRVFIADEGRSA